MCHFFIIKQLLQTDRQLFSFIQQTGKLSNEHKEMLVLEIIQQLNMDYTYHGYYNYNTAQLKLDTVTRVSLAGTQLIFK